MSRTGRQDTTLAEETHLLRVVRDNYGYGADEQCGSCGSRVYSCECGWYGCLHDDNDEARAHAGVSREDA